MNFRVQKYKDELKNKKRKKLLSKAVVLCLLIVIGMVSSIYLLFFSKLLDVRSITIEAADEMRAQLNIAAEDWLNKKFGFFPRRSNILFLSGDQLSSTLIDQFPRLESARVVKKIPHSLEISVEERKSAGIWCLSDGVRCLYFDKNGVAFNETQSSAGYLILNVKDMRSRELKLGDIVADNIWLASIIKARELLTKNDLDIRKFVIPAESFDEFYAITASGWKIVFSNSTDISKQIDALRIFLEEKPSINQKANLQYIDLRIQDRIYYK
ncbi:MAG: hypothetical protein A2831_01305 [Candidatus Yanofskybacteria bacterium RIFCSPHIGHO2_01_FULL_44_17]|uniref:POTRA domain-containing protein n=1 Tax=Candidatus Yanofskybacteria bacterium RIFCSPHIGHO2_01_FULL_44_17 TaxID=1802668 RepID=A0A1F8EV68_9BACT|nr:MAG: hypothetical protein A2831_01305 [Candidatus Yanofskybacteria bacterium RIFCSPHIGHO2_01_FULL_44_17]